MKIQTKLIKGDMCARPVNPHQPQISEKHIDGRHIYVNKEWTSFDQNEPYLPAPGFTEEGVFEGELVDGIKHTKGWSQLRDDEVDLYKKSNAETGKIFIPVEVRQERKVFTFYKINFINFNFYDGDFVYCKNVSEISKVLDDCEHVLDSEPDDKDRPYYIEIKPFPATNNEYRRLLEDYYN